MIPYGRHEIVQSDIDSVIRVLTSDFITQGDVVPNFEQSVADLVGVKYAVAVNSATSALHIACLALGLGRDDYLWVSPVTFVASANCALFCGANVDFVDIDPHTFNICAEALEHKLIEAKKVGRLPKILVAVHLGGQSCNMETINNLGKQYGFSIIEDASHAIGGMYKDKFIGSCCFSDIAIFSFHPVKIITTGEGGMAVTKNENLAKKMGLFRGHGITKDPGQMNKIPDGPWYYQQVDLGFNYRMTDIQAALGLSQLDRLVTYVARRNKLAKIYTDSFEKLPIKPQKIVQDCFSAYHLYIIRLDLSKIKKSHKEIFCDLLEEGIGVNIHYIPIHTHPYFKRFGFREYDFPNAMSYYSEALSIPMFPKMTEDEQSYTISTLKRVLEK